MTLDALSCCSDDMACFDILETVLCRHPVESNAFDTAACHKMGLELVHVTHVLYGAACARVVGCLI